MSVQLDELFDEPPGVVAVVLSHAIEEAGWRLVHVSETGDQVVWEVDDAQHGQTRLEASIVSEGPGARVRVVSVGDTTGASASRWQGRGHELVRGHDELADVVDLHPRDGSGASAPWGGGSPPFGIS